MGVAIRVITYTHNGHVTDWLVVSLVRFEDVNENVCPSFLDFKVSRDSESIHSTNIETLVFFPSMICTKGKDGHEYCEFRPVSRS